MNFHKLDASVYISSQISRDEIASAAAMGIKSIVNLRPDDEKGEYLTADEASLIAREFKLEYCHIPVLPTNITDENVSDFGSAFNKLPGPILAHCGTGKRASALWALCNRDSLPVEEIIRLAAAAGHDLSGLKPRLE